MFGAMGMARSSLDGDVVAFGVTAAGARSGTFWGFDVAGAYVLFLDRAVIDDIAIFLTS